MKLDPEVEPGLWSYVGELFTNVMGHFCNRRSICKIDLQLCKIISKCTQHCECIQNLSVCHQIWNFRSVNV